MKSIKKLAVLMLSAAMMITLLASCGGGGGGGTEEAAAEPNAGIRGVVFALPDGWATSGAAENYMSFDKDGTDHSISINSTTGEDLESWKSYGEDIETTDINEYYKTNNEKSKKNLKKYNGERKDIKVCGADGYDYTYKNGKGEVAERYITWLMDDAYYGLSIYNPDTYDENGKIKDDAPALPDEDAAAFDAIVASLQAGDGTAKMKEYLSSINSIGVLTFEVPEGFYVDSYSETYLDMKDDAETDFYVSITNENELQYIEDENGNKPSSVEEEWKNRTKWMEDSEKTTIAGYDGYLNEYPDENGNYYNLEALFYTGDEIYDISMFRDAYDENGNLKSDAKAITDDEKAAFESFVKSVKAK